jgi:HNH endonuclease
MRRRNGPLTSHPVSSDQDQRLNDSVVAERMHRYQLWATLNAEDATAVAPARLRELGVYGGAQGIWVDKARTRAVDAEGVTMSVLHTGSSYADDLYDGGLLYHYPTTGRVAGRDSGEVASTKAANRLGLPIFVVTYPRPNASVRRVDLAWVEAWDEADRVFLITYGETPPPAEVPADELDGVVFELSAVRNRRSTLATSRQGQYRFKFNVFRRYGACCAVCDLSVGSLLDAAHLKSYRDHGTDDPRNGLVLCALHHRAFDVGLFAIEPESLSVVVRQSGVTASDLKLGRESLAHLERKPHRDALAWRWRAWNSAG